MQVIEDSKQFDLKEKVSINRFRCHQQALFLSDFMNAGGKSIDSQYLKRRAVDKQWSHLIFPIKVPPTKTSSSLDTNNSGNQTTGGEV